MNLNTSQRLNIPKKYLSGVPSFHELTKVHIKSANKVQKIQGSTTTPHHTTTKNKAPFRKDSRKTQEGGSSICPLRRSTIQLLAPPSGNALSHLRNKCQSPLVKPHSSLPSASPFPSSSRCISEGFWVVSPMRKRFRKLLIPEEKEAEAEDEEEEDCC